MSHCLRSVAGTQTRQVVHINHGIIVHRLTGAALRQWGAATLTGRDCSIRWGWSAIIKKGEVEDP